MSTEAWTPPSPGDIPAPPRAPPHDIHSFANLLEIKPKHIDIQWTVDWNKRIIFGTVTHTIHVTKEGVDQFILDTSYLDIEKVSSGGKELKWSLGKRTKGLGSPLIVELGRTKKGEKFEIAITYSTTEQCTTLGWLTAEQTESKKSPFLYSQAQAIHGRSILPCVDSPSHKITYTAKVKSEVPVLMSALAEGAVRATENEPGEAFVKDEGIYQFRQPVGIPTYLIAIVGGLLEFRALGPRVGVWAEPAMIDRAEWEFKKDAPRFLEAAEETISPYSWTRYDSVVLPPSFPYGGMENANLTTLTPSLICGDRSQTDVLLHELAHSWSGNLTSCGNWSSFWLNEGINVWIERVLLQVVNGPEAGPAFRGFSYIIGAKALKDALEQFESIKRFQRLVPEFKEGEDPDDAFSSIPYEKGSNLILYLERLVGGLDMFLPFIRSHFTTFYDRSVTTEEWKQHLFDFYAGNKEITKKLEDVDWHGWLYGEGLELPVKMEYNNSLAVQSQKLADRWIKVAEGKTTAKSEKFGMKDIQGWDSNQVVVFVGALHSGPKMSSEVAEELDKTYDFSTSTNPEIRLRFYEVALEDVKTKYKQEAADWVAKQGRMKYCRVMYRAINKVDSELARSTFTKNRSFYHPIAAAMIATDLELVSKTDKGRCLIAICGSTGTGKSQLAVELAQHLGRSEIISADSMQIYQGLDVITNKVTEEETQGIPHHLMSFLDPKKDEEYDVGSFIRDANKVILEMEKESKMTIIVGGTTYYIQHLLLPGRLISSRSEEEDEYSKDQTNGQSREVVEVIAKKASSIPLRSDQFDLLHHILSLSHSSTNVSVESVEVWKLLQCLDEEMASRWHFQDTRKIIRSIKVLFETGRRHSELINEQNKEQSQQNYASQDIETNPTKVLIFNIECDRQVLIERLDTRVEKMIDNGLLREILDLRAIARKRSAPTDYTRGIFQSIGYKEFDAYLYHIETTSSSFKLKSSSLRPDENDEKGLHLFNQAVEEMKISTHQLARKQVQWIRNKLRPEIKSRSNHNVHLISLDATDVNQWETNVTQKAVQLTDAFLANHLTSFEDEEQAGKDEKLQTQDQDKTFRICPECTIDPLQPFRVLQSKWQLHQKGRKHRACVRRLQGKAKAMTGPEVEAKRKERQQRKQQISSSTTSSRSSNSSDEEKE